MNTMKACVPNVEGVHLLKFREMLDHRGDLIVMEEGIDVPIIVKRIFIVKGSDGTTRGKHAHYKCTQIISCLSGLVRVCCEDGSHSKEFVLEGANTGLLIPPGIWAEQIYDATNTVLHVMCDRIYEEEDYIRDYKCFKQYKKDIEKL